MLGDSDAESSSSAGSSLNALKVNEDYAKAYARRKEREELQKLKDKYGSDADEDALSSDESSSETEDEDGEELTPQVDAAILRTLARIRKKDPAIYDSAKHVFQEEQQKTAASRPLTKETGKGKNSKDKPLTIKQHALNAVLAGSRSPSPSLQPTHVEEQRALRDETIKAFAAAAEAEDDDFLVPREKTKDEIEREEEEYRAFLEREVGEDIAGLVEVETEEQWRQQQQHAEDEDEKRDKDKKKSKKSKGKEKEKARDPDEDQKFLLDYILNRGWIDKSAKRVPTYSEVTSSKHKSKSKSKKKDEEASSSDEKSSSDSDGQAEEEEEDEVFEAAAEHFEEDYMYRFQEPGAATINAHPRKIPTLVRREDTRRKEARERRKARKEEELLRKREEVKRLKALKVKELRRKLERIGREGGAALEREALAALDLESEWDPAKHDAQMADIYAGEPDAPDADADAEDMEKPTWDDDIDIGDIAPESEPNTSTKKDKKKKKKKRKHGEEEEEGEAVDEAAMDAEWQGDGEGEREEEWDGTEAMRKRKLEEYMASLDTLEFNDIVGGLPTRFKYTQVAADDFGLTPAEILMATDAELNSYVGVKRYAPYRKDRGRRWGPQHGEKLRELREKLRERGAVPVAGAGEGEGAGEVKKKRKGKKERMKEKLAGATGEQRDGDGDGDGEPKKKKKKKRHSAVEGDA